MKKILFLCIAAAFSAFIPQSDACVGRIIHIGIPGSADERLLAEMMSLLINERTGSTVKVVPYKDSKELYAAVKKGDVNILIENTDRALDVLSRPKEPDIKAAYETVKQEYRKNMNLVWLELLGGTGHYAPVLTVETLTNFPALPKLLNKLAGALNNGGYAKLISAAKTEAQAKKAAKDFLKSKKLI